MRQLLIIFLAICFCTGLTAQVQVSGTVTDSMGKPLQSVSITLAKKNGLILAFGITGPTGAFKINWAGAFVKDSLLIESNAISYKKQSIAVTSAVQTVNFRLNVSVNRLPNVNVTNSKPMLKREGDTLSYDVNAFSNKQDRVIGDVIKKLPGVEVSESGQISVGGKPINRFYIDGDNLLDGRYNLATKNIPSDAVAKVQVLENHQPVNVLKNLVKSEDPAMNIVLKDNARLRVMSNGDAAAGVPSVYDLSMTSMLFRKEVKFINNTRLNNSGYDLSNDVNNFFGSDAPPPRSLVSASTAGSPDLVKQRYLFNNAGLVSLNDMIKLKRDWQLRINAYYTQDVQFQDYRFSSTYYLPSDTINYREVQQTRRASNTFNTQFTLTANRPDYYLNNVTTIENSPLRVQAELQSTSNGNIAQQYSGTVTNLSNRFNLIKKVSKGTSYEISSSINAIRNPETLVVSPGLFAAQLNGGNAYAGLSQDAAIPTFYTDNYISFGIPHQKFKQQYRAGVNYQQQELNSALSSEQLNGAKALVADSFRNNLDWQRLRAYLQATYTYTDDKLLLTLSLPVTYQDIRYTGRQVRGHLQDLPVTPRISLRYNTAREDFFSLGYGYANSWADINQVYDGYIMRSYRDFFSNGPELTTSRSQNSSLTYNHRNTLKIFFLSFGATYGKSIRNTISDQRISSTIQQSRLIPFNNESTNASAFIASSKYFIPLMTTFDVRLSWQRSNGLQKQNDVLLRVQSDGYSAGLHTNTKFSDMLAINYGLDFSTSKSRTADDIHGNDRPVTPAVKNWRHTVNAYLSFNAALHATVTAENYTYLLPGQQDVRVTFLDALFNWKIDKLKTTISIGVTNLANIDTYTNLSLSANGISESVYRIRPRTAMIKFYYKF
ncbi:MAG: hypothetical protein JO301_17865 [Chitinophagaceae bacterium]|nr:hypothetical protein [Chitinophagaceae bacterium]